MTVQISKTGTFISDSDKDLENLKQKFNSEHCIVLKKLLEPALLKYIQDKMEQIQFYTVLQKNKLREEQQIKDKGLLGFLIFLMNDQKLFDFIEYVTGCSKIGCFTGRVYRMDARSKHFDLWHSDMDENRMVAVSVNLSTKKFSSGLLQMRNYHSKEIIYEIANTGFGDAIIFQLSDSLQHRNTSIKGSFSKTAFTGWFRSKPSYHTFLKKGDSEKASKLFKVCSASNKMIGVKDKLRFNKEILHRTVRENLFFFNLNNSYFYKLDPIGMEIGKELIKHKRISKVFNNMKKKYTVESQILQKDIMKVACLLQENKLLASNQK